MGLDGRVDSERSTWPPLRRAAEETLGGKVRDEGDEHIALLAVEKTSSQICSRLC